MKPNSELARSVAGGGRAQQAPKRFWTRLCPTLSLHDRQDPFTSVVNVWKARGDKFAHGGRPDPRDKAGPVAGPRKRSIPI